MNISFLNQNVLITGATRGIGKSLSELFFDSDANLFLTGTNKDEVDILNKKYHNSNRTYFQLDLNSKSSISNFIKKLNNITKIDVLINNAGINRLSEFVNSDDDDYTSIMNVNLKGPYMISKEISKLMIKGNYGRIINICSIWSKITKPKRSIYTISKNGLHGMTQTMSVELSKYNILVNSVSPGFTLTELTKSTNTPEEIEEITQKIPINRMAGPNEIANVILFLSSDKNTYLTGQNIVVDGGYSIV